MWIGENIYYINLPFEVVDEGKALHIGRFAQVSALLHCPSNICHPLRRQHRHGDLHLYL